MSGADAVHISSESKQDYVTPAWFVKACEQRFGVNLVIDLAADAENTRCLRWYTKEVDSLKCDWMGGIKGVSFAPDLMAAGWLNPEFRKTPAFMEKCAIVGAGGTKVIALTLSSLGTQWYKKFVKPNALSLILEDRLIFEGQTDPYPKELMVSLFGFGMTGLGWWAQGKGP